MMATKSKVVMPNFMKNVKLTTTNVFQRLQVRNPKTSNITLFAVVGYKMTKLLFKKN